jgi:ribosome-binding factor A
MPYMGRMAANRFSRGKGPSQRQLRVGELIRRTLSEVLMHGEVHDDELNGISVTVGEVSISADLRVATAYVSPLGGKGGEALLKALRRNTGELRHLVSRDMTLKFTPELRFQLDTTFDRLDETRRMFADETVRRDIARPDDAAPQDD